MANTRSRKWQLTFNNPLDYGVTHSFINETMKELMWQYYCLCDEIGEEEHTPHTHLYFYCENPISFDRAKKLYPSAHIEKCVGTSADNRNYIRKEGRHADKSITSLPETFEEYGELPDDTKSKNDTVSAEVLGMIKNGNSVSEIIDEHPSFLLKIPAIEKASNIILGETYGTQWRDVKVTYISGPTKTGKTRYVMDTFGYSNVCKVTNYQHPFDNYKGEDVLLLDEFRSSLPFGELLQYLDGYPCWLPARYSDKLALFTEVFIVSNIDLDKQYPNIQIDDKRSWNALVRRISSIVKYEKNVDFPFANENSIFNYNIAPENYILGD